MIEILLGVSIVIIGLLSWYVIQLLKRFLNISEELEGLFVSLEEYSEHVDIVYNLERFYGDTTLENLLHPDWPSRLIDRPKICDRRRTGQERRRHLRRNG